MPKQNRLNGKINLVKIGLAYHKLKIMQLVDNYAGPRESGAQKNTIERNEPIDEQVQFLVNDPWEIILVSPRLIKVNSDSKTYFPKEKIIFKNYRCAELNKGRVTRDLMFACQPIFPDIKIVVKTDYGMKVIPLCQEILYELLDVFTPKYQHKNENGNEFDFSFTPNITQAIDSLHRLLDLTENDRLFVGPEKHNLASYLVGYRPIIKSSDPLKVSMKDAAFMIESKRKCPDVVH